MKTAFSCTSNAIIRGSLCSGIDQFPTLFFYSPINRGGGHGPLVPPSLSYASANEHSQRTRTHTHTHTHIITYMILGKKHLNTHKQVLLLRKNISLLAGYSTQSYFVNMQIDPRYTLFHLRNQIFSNAFSHMGPTLWNSLPLSHYEILLHY